MSQAVQTTDCWDVNSNMDTDTDADIIRMCDVLSMHDVAQHVTVPTHVSGHTPDEIINRHNNELLLSCPKTDYIVSDHMFELYRPPLETDLL